MKENLKEESISKKIKREIKTEVEDFDDNDMYNLLNHSFNVKEEPADEVEKKFIPVFNNIEKTNRSVISNKKYIAERVIGKMGRKKKASRVCCVTACSNNSNNAPPGTRFYSFSTRAYNKSKRDKWITALKMDAGPDGSPWQPKFHTRICSQHFVGNQKSEHPLSPSYIPTIFSSIDHKIESTGKAATARFRRSLNRQAPAATIVNEEKRKSKSVAINRSKGNSSEITHEDPNYSNKADLAKQMTNREIQIVLVNILPHVKKESANDE